MNCKDADELMSLKLDGLLGSEGERELQFHMENCSDCGPLWDAMQEADNLILKWVSEPVVVPVGFHSKVMARIAVMPVERPAFVPAVRPVPAAASPAATGPIASPPLFQGYTRPLTGALPTQLTEYLHGWQGRIAAPAKAVGVAALAILGSMGLIAALLATGLIQLDGPFADVARSIGTALGAVGTWARALFLEIGPEVWIASVTIMGLLVLAGWQVVAGYQRSAAEQRRNTGYLEATS
jgi:Putative zinc-finger